MQHYQQNELYDGSHNEGGIVRMLFGLFFWEVMFADVEDVFQSPYQTYPLDLSTSWFVKNRKQWIEDLLKQIKGMGKKHPKQKTNHKTNKTNRSK